METAPHREKTQPCGRGYSRFHQHIGQWKGRVSAAKVLLSSSSSVRASGTAVHGRTEAAETCPYKRSSADETGDAKRCSNEAAHRIQPRPEVHLSKLDDEARRSSPGTNSLKAEDRSPLGKGMFLDFFPAQGDLPQPSNRWVYLFCFDSTGDQRWKPF